jgi:hypothetical protein
MQQPLADNVFALRRVRACRFAACATLRFLEGVPAFLGSAG